ncbi:hypothetical protein B0H17DRAFT_1129325 [Mycena rosella]|uniref:Uncharacterized protein n=1 Tax=Mycena rosella TaxID=1033263 RepID=A0AAD7DW54_MYCRO|nr:hypothetical protein B0H17DRAFT_1129325 [Mycena rosella]
MISSRDRTSRCHNSAALLRNPRLISGNRQQACGTWRHPSGGQAVVKRWSSGTGTATQAPSAVSAVIALPPKAPSDSSAAIALPPAPLWLLGLGLAPPLLAELWSLSGFSCLPPAVSKQFQMHSPGHLIGHILAQPPDSNGQLPFYDEDGNLIGTIVSHEPKKKKVPVKHYDAAGHLIGAINLESTPLLRITQGSSTVSRFKEATDAETSKASSNPFTTTQHPPAERQIPSAVPNRQPRTANTASYWDGWPNSSFVQFFRPRQVRDTNALECQWASESFGTRKGSLLSEGWRQGKSMQRRCLGVIDFYNNKPQFIEFQNKEPVSLEDPFNIIPSPHVHFESQIHDSSQLGSRQSSLSPASLENSSEFDEVEMAEINADSEADDD